jgi:hypothetical protein
MSNKQTKAMKLALGKIKSARDCHFAAIDTLLFEAEEILEAALAEQPRGEATLAHQEPVAYQDTVGKCRLETVPAKGGLLPAQQSAGRKETAVTYGEVEQAMQALRHGTFMQKQMYEAMKDKPLYTAHGITSGEATKKGNT